jgi:hypothetical protein
VPGRGGRSRPGQGVNLLDSDPLTLAAGGTSLQASHTTGAYIGETAWNTPADQTRLGRLGRRLQFLSQATRSPFCQISTFKQDGVGGLRGHQQLKIFKHQQLACGEPLADGSRLICGRVTSTILDRP